MIYSKRLILMTLMLLCVVLSVSAVSAAADITVEDVNATSTIEVGVSNLDVDLSSKLSTDDAVSNDGQSEKVSNGEANNEIKNFTQLQTDINNGNTLSGTYKWQSGENTTGIAISTTKTIICDNAIIDGSNNARAFDITGSVTINGTLTIKYCQQNNGGAIYVEGACTVNGNLTIFNCSAVGGGAISVYTSANFTVNGNLTIFNCSATTEGGAIRNYGSNDWRINFIVNGNLTIFNCIATNYGGAIRNAYSYSFIYGNLTIFNCSATKQGGAIYITGTTTKLIANGTLTIINCSAINGSAIYSNVNTTCNNCIFDCVGSNVVYLGKSVKNSNLNGNYWAVNCTSAKDFRTAQLIYNASSSSYIAPDNWVVMNITNSSEIVSGESASFSVTLNTLNTGSAFTGSLHDYDVVISGATGNDDIPVTIRGGVGNFSYTASAPGNFTLTANGALSGKELFTSNNFTAEGSSVKDVDVNITVQNITYGTGSPIATVDVVIYEKGNTTVVGGKDDVSFIIYDATGNVVDNSTWANLAAGNYSVMAVFAGNDSYNPANSTRVNFTINQAIPNIVFGPINNVIKGTAPTFTANATDNNDQFIAEITNFTIYNGETPVTTPWNQLAPGNYTVVATYEGNENYTSKSENRTFKVADEDSFTALQILINEHIANGTDLTLEHDYQFNAAYDNEEGVEIEGTLTINGNGKIINGNNQARALIIIDPYNKNYIVTITNKITFINCSATENGGAISNEGTLIFNSSSIVFKNDNTTENGGAISNEGTLIFNSSSIVFKNCSATANGGAIATSYNLIFEDSNITFNNCSTTGKGGAIYKSDYPQSLRFDNCSSIIFENCHADDMGGAMYIYGLGFAINGAIFDNCTSPKGVIAYMSMGISFNRNYWCVNCTNASEFINAKIIYNEQTQTFVSPSDWILMDIVGPDNLIIGETYTFNVTLNKLNTGEDYTGSLGDYNVIIPNDLGDDINITIHEGIGSFNYTVPATPSNFSLAGISPNSNNILVNNTFTAKKNVNVTVVATNITYGQVSDFTATVVDAENGTIIDTEDIYFIVFDSNNDEVDESEWNNLNVGTYKVMAHFNGNELYVAKSSENETFTVNNANIKSIDIVINDISYGNEFVININNAIGVKDELLNGTVNLTISKKNSNGDEVYEFNVTNGAGSYTISDLYAAGDYDFNVKFNAPNYNEKDINIENVNVAKITPTVIITVEDVEYNHTLAITSTVTGLNGVILDNSSVELHIFNATGEETDKKPLPVGNYTVYATYISNNENYTDANSTDKEFEVYDTAAKISIVEDLYESVVGQKVNITLNLTKKVEGDYIELYISNFDSNRIDIDDFIEGSDGNYYYNYTVDTTGFTKTIIGIAAKLFNENDEPISNALSKLKINFTVPKINTTNIIGNYSDKVNVTFTITNGSDGDIVVLHHIDGINLTTTVKDNKAIFTDVYLSKFGEYTTEVIYTRNNVGLSTVNVNWNISKLPTNITFNPANVTGDVSEILSVNVTVKDSKNNTVSTGKITVTDSKIKLVYENGTDYDGNVYNLTNGSVKIWFKYLEEGVYTPEFNYTNPNSTYGNTNNYLYSSEELNVVINKSSVNITVYTDYRNVSGKVYDNITIMGKVLDNLKNVPEGTISITVNGITFNGTINSTTGEYKIIINSTTNFTDTNIPINFTSGNTTRWLDTESTSPDVVNVTINLINTNVVVNPLVYNKTATQSFNITGTVTSIGTDLIPTGNVTIKIDDTYYNATVGTDGNFTIEITNGISKAGNWTNLNVTFTSSQPNVFANNESASNINITINTLNTTIYVTNGPEFNGSVYETITITGNVTATNGEAAEGNVTMIINGKTFNATVGTDGKFTLKVNSTTKLDKQAYNITFTSNNNARWANSIGENITNITVFALNTTINITSDKIVIKKVNETYYINGTITDDIYNKGVNGTVTITVNEKTYNTTTNENGEFSFTLNSTTSFGPENCTVSFKNNNSDVWNDPENEYVNITIERLNTYINIISYNESVYIGQTITLKGNVTDENNNPVSGITTILYWPEGSGTESTTTDENGEFTIEITCQNAHEMADYTVESYFTTSNVYNNPENQTISYEIKKLPTTVSVDNITYTGKVNSTITITGTVNDTIYNNPANGTVSLTLNGKEFNTTLVNGKYSLNVSCNVSGTYRNIVVKYKTNNNTVWENSTSEKITIKIETLTVYITSNYDLESKEAYNGTFNRLRNYTFNVTDEKGNAVLNGTLNLNLDNETLTTNVTNGQATFKNVLFNDTGLFNFIVDYVGNKFYKSAFNFTKINVAKVATTIYINSSINDNNKVLNITVKDNIDNKTVIKGTIYYVTPDGQGHEKNLTDGSTIVDVVANRTGEYDIAVSYYDLEQDYLYSEQDFKYNITVAGIETQFQGITDPSNGANGNKLLITSIVRSDKGDIIKEGIIDYIINGKKYSVTLNNGVTNLEVPFDGPTQVIAKYTGKDCTQPKEVYIIEPSFENENIDLTTLYLK